MKNCYLPFYEQKQLQTINRLLEMKVGTEFGMIITKGRPPSFGVDFILFQVTLL